MTRKLQKFKDITVKYLAEDSLFESRPLKSRQSVKGPE